MEDETDIQHSKTTAHKEDPQAATWIPPALPKSPPSPTPRSDVAHGFDDSAVTSGRTRYPNGNADPWSQKTVLNLDGKGIHGFASLLIIRSLMRAIAALEIESEEEVRGSVSGPALENHTLITRKHKVGHGIHSKTSRFLPCHYFDYCAGTGTGGLIAIMLGRLRMTVEECMQQYEAISRKMAGISTINRILIHFPIKSNLSTKRLSKTALDVLRNSESYPADDKQCKTIVIGVDSRNGIQTPHVFRSYDLHKIKDVSWTPSFTLKDRGKATDSQIWQAARATSAAPTFFDPIKIGPRPPDLSYEVFNEVSSTLQPGEAIGVFANLGTGKPQSPGALSRSATGDSHIACKKWSKQTFKSSRGAMAVIPKGDTDRDYRLGVHCDLDGISQDDWKSFSQHGDAWRRLTELTEQKIHEIVPQVEELARKLVDLRRQRCRTERWERFALGSWYRCTYKGCSQQERPFETRTALIAHLQKQHGFPPPDRLNYQDQFQSYLVNGFFQKNPPDCSPYVDQSNIFR